MADWLANDFLRADWGVDHTWDPELSISDYLGVEVHHGGADHYSREATALPGIRDYHINGKGWRDIWYHLAIDSRGDVYEARGVDVKNSSDGDHLTVLFLGGYGAVGANQLQLDALTRVRKELMRLNGGDNLTWHRERGGSSCPGDALIAQLETVRERSLMPGTSIYPESSAPPVAILEDRDSYNGYAVVTADGGVFTFGVFPFWGSAHDFLSTGSTIVAASGDGRGYTLLGSDGSIYNFGDSVYSGRIVVVT